MGASKTLLDVEAVLLGDPVPATMQRSEKRHASLSHRSYDSSSIGVS